MTDEEVAKHAEDLARWKSLYEAALLTIHKLQAQNDKYASGFWWEW